MSNSNNIGKELKRLRKELAEVESKDSKFHFVVGDKNENAEAKLERFRAEGKIAVGDTYQLVQVPWIVRELKGSSKYIPEGSSADPLADPGLPLPQSVSSSWGEERDRDKRWADHVRQIERDGQRFDPDKKTDAGWC